MADRSTWLRQAVDFRREFPVELRDILAGQAGDLMLTESRQDVLLDDAAVFATGRWTQTRQALLHVPLHELGDRGSGSPCLVRP